MNLPQPFYDTAVANEALHPEFYDQLLAQGWRHFGAQFFRYNVMEHDGQPDYVLPLRIDVEHFELSKSQRRVLRKNADVEVHYRPFVFSEEAEALFLAHRRRFVDNVPESLTTFLGNADGGFPVQCMEMQVRHEGRLIAASYFDLGYRSTSSVYGTFDPLFSERSLGVFTLLKEIEWAKAQGMRFVYHGYSTIRPGIYEYKKRFTGMEFYHWEGDKWHPGKILVNLTKKFSGLSDKNEAQMV